jgi:D-cysteine desulfhydrase
VAELPVDVVGVRVVPTFIGSEAGMAELTRDTSRFLHERDGTFPLVEMKREEFTVVHDFYGGEYGLHTPEALAAIERVRDSAGIELDGTYTGKAAAAMLAGIESASDGGPVLFWDTKSSRQAPPEVQSQDYRALPRPLHRYFEEETKG